MSAPRATLLADAGSVGLGAALGAIARFCCSFAFTQRGYSSRLSIVGINVVGSFCLGALATASPVPRRMKLGLGVGFCGGFTTFSTFAVDMVSLVEAGEMFMTKTTEKRTRPWSQRACACMRMNV